MGVEARGSLRGVKEQILPYVQQGFSPKRIVSTTGLSRAQVVNARVGILHSNPELKKKQQGVRSESHQGLPTSERQKEIAGSRYRGKGRTQEERRKMSLAKGGIWGYIDTYAYMGMAKEAIQEAVRLERGVILDKSKIRRTLEMQKETRRRNRQLPLTVNSFPTGSELTEVVTSYVGVKLYLDREGLDVSEVLDLSKKVRILLENKQQPMPESILEEMFLDLAYYGRKKKTDGDSRALEQLKVLWDMFPATMREELRPRLITVFTGSTLSVS